jgi:hypothetical protein
MENTMKKLVCMIAVFALTAPVMADITFTATESSPGVLTIGYTTDDPCSLPVGFGLILDAGADDIDAYVDGAPEFDIFIDYASDDPCAYTLGAGHPVAKVDMAGSLTLPASSCALCMGILDDQNDPPAASTNLATLEVCDATVTISADPLRGGPVDQNGNAMVNNLPLVVALGSCDVGCPGDLDGDNQRTLNDLGLLSDALFAAGAPFIVPCP